MAKGAVVFDAEAVYGKECDPSPARAETFFATQAEVVRARELVRQVAVDLGLPEARVPELVQRVSAARREDTLILDISAKDDDPKFARTLCNAMMNAFVQQRIHRVREPLAARAEFLEHEAEELGHADGGALARAKVEEKLAELQVDVNLVANDARVLEICELPAPK